MKLVIQRDQRQQKGLLGGNKGAMFSISCQVQLTPQEQDLVKRYRVENEKLVAAGTLKASLTQELTIGTLIQSVSLECPNIGALLESEKEIRNACRAFKNYLDVMATFGGQEVVEIE